MEGIAKTVPAAKIEVVTQTVSPGIESLKYNDVPVDVYRFFGIDTLTLDSRNLDKLKDISQWAFEGVETLGDGLKKLRDLEVKLGSASVGKRWDKMYNWVKIQKHIEDMLKRQEALSGVRH